MGLTEMSSPAYIAAIEQGADGFECDVRLTADSELICWHDSDTSRITGQKAVIANTRYEDLKFANPMKFEDLLRLAIAHKKGIAIETKHPVATGGLVEKKVLEILLSYEVEILKSGINILLMSFSWRAMQRCKEIGVNTAFLFKRKYLATIAMTPVIGPSIAVIRKNPELVEQAHHEGKLVYIWTVNSDEDIQLCARLGVDLIATDNPARARSLLG